MIVIPDVRNYLVLASDTSIVESPSVVMVKGCGQSGQLFS